MAEYIRPEDVPAGAKVDLQAFGKKLSPDAASALELAVQAGWTISITSKESCTLLSPVKGGKNIHYSVRSPIPLHRMIRQISRWGDPDRLAVMDRLAIKVHDGDEKAIDEWNTMEDVAHEISGVYVQTPSLEPKKERFVPDPSPASLVQKAAQKVKNERHVISERPHLMHYNISSGGGKSYPSKTTLERRWSDGSVDYVCAVATCDKVSDSHLSFRGAHWAMHVRKGEAQPYDKDEARASVVDDPSYTESAWTRKASAKQERVAALTNMLKAVSLDKVTPEELAAMIVEFLGDSGGGGGTGEPLTDAQIIDRIRTMVDRGTYADQETEIIKRDVQITELTEYAETVQADLEQKVLIIEQRAVKAEATLAAFRDLVNEATSE